MKKSISLLEVKQALLDPRFRDNLPLEQREGVAKFLQNPNCPCNLPLYREILKSCSKQLLDYYPDRDLEKVEEVRLAENRWSVINCQIHELEDKLRSLPPGRKQIAVARYDEFVTVIVNEIDLI